jgi:hypothetical protein
VRKVGVELLLVELLPRWGLGTIGSRSRHLSSCLDEVISEIAKPVAVEIISLSPEPSTTQSYEATLNPASTPSNLGTEVLKYIEKLHFTFYNFNTLCYDLYFFL